MIITGYSNKYKIYVCLCSVERKYVVYEALKYGAVMMLCTHLITRKIRNRKAWDLYFNVKKKR